MSKKMKMVLAALLIVVAAGLAYAVLTRPDDRNAVQKIGDAIEALPDGAENAARELEDRTPGERITDQVKDAVGTE